jgi:hypothetical protein
VSPAQALEPDLNLEFCQMEANFSPQEKLRIGAPFCRDGQLANHFLNGASNPQT